MTHITKRTTDYSAWYNDLVEQADLAEHSPVRGCMIVKPYGWSIWEAMKSYLDKRIKATGHTNAQFPLFIPKSFLSKEANHIEGFAKECAVVTHYRLKTSDDEVVVDPEAKLEEPLIVRPTSETIIWNTYKKWIQSYRDLPLLINQWANVVRWEMRTRPFLRTTEFFWQEGHTAHETPEEADKEARMMIEEYRKLAEDVMAVPVIVGRKSPSERFAGAIETYTIEGLMQDGKALQMGTSHNLGQNFSKAFDVQYQSRNETLEYPYATSWGVSTRLMGGLIMAHSDDAGLVLPPKIAPIQVVVVPIYKKEGNEALNTAVQKIVQGIQQTMPDIRIFIDTDEQKRPGFKFSEWEMKGIPIRLSIGQRDLENGTVEFTRRDTGEKSHIMTKELAMTLPKILTDIQQNLYQQAIDFRTQNTHTATNWNEFVDIIQNKKGFVLAYWDGTEETEEAIKKATKATIRCIPFDVSPSEGFCVYSGKPNSQQVLFAVAY